MQPKPRVAIEASVVLRGNRSAHIPFLRENKQGVRKTHLMNKPAKMSSLDFLLPIKKG